MSGSVDAAAATTETSPFGDKNLEAVTTPIQVAVTGTIPAWVNGVLYRTGLGTFNIPKPDGTRFQFKHPFDGLSLLHRFEIHGTTGTEDGHGEGAYVIYSSRHTAHGVKKRIIKNDSTLVFFGPDPCRTIFSRIQSIYHQFHDIGAGVSRHRMETDAEGENINVTITPNFPLPARLEDEWGVRRGMGLVVKTDANMLQVVDEESLEPRKVFTYEQLGGEGLGERFAAAHGEGDGGTGEYFNFTMTPFPRPTWQVFSIRTNSEGEVVTRKFDPVSANLAHQPSPPILGFFGNPRNLLPPPALKTSYIHSFWLTEHYVVLPLWSYYFTYSSLSVLYHGNAYEALHFDPKLPTLFQVLERQSGRHVATYEAESAFAFHTCNAWEEEDEETRERVVVLDGCVYPDAGIVDASFDFGRMYGSDRDVAGGEEEGVDQGKVRPALYTNSKRKIGRREGDEDVPSPEVRRYRLVNVPYEGRAEHLECERDWRCTYESLGWDLDLPRFDPRRKGKPYRYLYGTCRNIHIANHVGASGVILNGIQKLNLDTRIAKKWMEPNSSCSEPVFIPRPGSEEEDDGVVLTMVNAVGEGGEERCELVVLDARRWEKIGSACLGGWHAKSVHGSFVDANGVGVSVT
ncbi:hypothetical protein YB2330_002386 [Saitoella coloradoensis]